MRNLIAVPAASSVVAIFIIIALVLQQQSSVRHFPAAYRAEDQPCLWQRWKPTVLPGDDEQAFRPLIHSTLNGSVCILAYSAYLDQRLSSVKILTDVDKACSNLSAGESPSAYCLVWYQERSEPHQTPLRFDYVATHNPHRSPRVGVVYACDIHSNNQSKPYAVSILSDKQRCQEVARATTLHIFYPSGNELTFVVCTPPIFGNTRLSDLVQFIEMHRILGAERFHFYNASISAELSKLLQRYVKEGVVQVIQWHSIYPQKVFYNNQGIMQIDCMYRNMFKAKYVAQMDVDEVLMPRGAFRSWKQLADKRFTNGTAMIVFRNRYYTTDTTVQCPLPNATAIISSLLPSYMKRLKYYNMTFKPAERSKIIYSPERISRIWTHSATPYQGYKTVVLEMEEGVLHHYRFSSSGTNDSLLDIHMCTLIEPLYERMRRRLSFV